MNRKSNSNEYELLQRRIETLKENFGFHQSSLIMQNPAEELTPKHEDMLRGLILLCHAEFENYFESVAIKLIDNAELVFNNSDITDNNLISLSKKAINELREIIKGNNGIKKDSIKKMFTPLGYSISDDFDGLLITDLDSFGTKRGAIAHTSTIGTNRQLDKMSTMSTIRKILDAIEDFENVIKSKAPLFFETPISELDLDTNSNESTLEVSLNS